MPKFNQDTKRKRESNKQQLPKFQERKELMKSKSPYSWTDEKDQLVIELLNEGKTNNEVADALSTQFKKGPRANENIVIRRSRIYLSNYPASNDSFNKAVIGAMERYMETIK